MAISNRTSGKSKSPSGESLTTKIRPEWLKAAESAVKIKGGMTAEEEAFIATCIDQKVRTPEIARIIDKTVNQVKYIKCKIRAQRESKENV